MQNLCYKALAGHGIDVHVDKDSSLSFKIIDSFNIVNSLFVEEKFYASEMPIKLALAHFMSFVESGTRKSLAFSK